MRRLTRTIIASKPSVRSRSDAEVAASCCVSWECDDSSWWSLADVSLSTIECGWSADWRRSDNDGDFDGLDTVQSGFLATGVAEFKLFCRVSWAWQTSGWRSFAEFSSSWTELVIIFGGSTDWCSSRQSDNDDDFDGLDTEQSDFRAITSAQHTQNTSMKGLKIITNYATMSIKKQLTQAACITCTAESM